MLVFSIPRDADMNAVVILGSRSPNTMQLIFDCSPLVVVLNGRGYLVVQINVIDRQVIGMLPKPVFCCQVNAYCLSYSGQLNFASVDIQMPNHSDMSDVHSRRLLEHREDGTLEFSK